MATEKLSYTIFLLFNNECYIKAIIRQCFFLIWIAITLVSNDIFFIYSDL